MAISSKTRDVLAIFNRGRIGRLAVARTDVARVALSAEVQTNWMPRTLGSMMLRPGLEFMGEARDDGAMLPFVYSAADSAILELSPDTLRVWDGGETLVTRASVSTLITNQDFTVDLAGWTDADDAGASSVWATGGYMSLTGTGPNSARRRQAVSIALTDQAVAHGLRIFVVRGPVLLRIGTTAGDDDVFRQAVLRTGCHSLCFIPNAATVHIEISSSLKYPTLVDSVAIEAGGVMEVTTPWVDADKCKSVRGQQSADVVFCTGGGFRPRRIERRENNSWSVVDYAPNDGPFLVENVENIRLTPSDISGQITLASSRGIFRSGHVGALFQLSSQGQMVTDDLIIDSTYTNYIRVTGVEDGRKFAVIRSGTWAGTLSLQRSIGEPGSWVTVATYTTNGTTTYDDGLDNSIAYYRIGFEAGNYTSGTASAKLEFAVGSITGVVRVIGFTSDVLVDAVVLTELGGITPTEVWAEGAWSDVQGWPDALALTEGRLWLFGQGRAFGSLPDGFSVFDPNVIGDSQPVNRRLGDGAVNSINWAMPLQNLIVGTDGAEWSIRSTSFDEPITPSNYNVKARTTKGSAPIAAVIADNSGYFVSRTTETVFELSYDANSYSYSALDAMTLVPEMGDGGLIRLGVQQSPDLRLHAVRTDGTIAVLVRDSAENVLCWVDMETDGIVEDVTVLPGTVEDRVFYRTKRVVDGVEVRYLERWALERDCRGGQLSKLADSFKTGTGSITGLDHLEGKTVVIWADGVDRGTAVVSGGAVAGSFTTWCAGLYYRARYKSAKLAGQTALGLSLTQRSRVNSIGLVLADTHAQGLRYGPTFETMDDLPLMESGAEVDPGAVWESYDEGMVEFPGDWSSDNRICLEASAPRPCTVLAAVLSIERQDHD